MKNKIEELPSGFILLQEENGRACYAACMIGQFSGWLMWKHPDGQWVSKRKLESWELMQVEDQRDDTIVFGAAPVQPVAVPDGEAQNYKIQAGEKIFYSRLGRGIDGLPFMTDSSEHAVWDIAMVFKDDDKRPSKVFRDYVYAADPAAQGDAKYAAPFMPENIETDDALWRSGCTAFRLALNEMTGCDGYVVKKIYDALRKHILSNAPIAAKAAS